MTEANYFTSITVDASQHQAFESINKVSLWWTENIDGSSHNLNDEFTVRFSDVHFSRQKLIEVVPDTKVVWLVTESKINFVQDKQEWTNTRIVFDISTDNDLTKVSFTHVGLVPEIECFNACSGAWQQYIQQSLWSLIQTGKGAPEKKVSAEVEAMKP